MNAVKHVLYPGKKVEYKEETYEIFSFDIEGNICLVKVEPKPNENNFIKVKMNEVT